MKDIRPLNGIKNQKNCLYKKYELVSSKDPFSIGVFFSLKELDGLDVWMRKTMSANGLSAKLIMKENLEVKSGQGELNCNPNKTESDQKGVEKFNPSYERKI